MMLISWSICHAVADRWRAVSAGENVPQRRDLLLGRWKTPVTSLSASSPSHRHITLSLSLSLQITLSNMLTIKVWTIKIDKSMPSMITSSYIISGRIHLTQLLAFYRHQWRWRYVFPIYRIARRGEPKGFPMCLFVSYYEYWEMSVSIETFMDGFSVEIV